MKTLSIQQPWASMIAYGIKDVENRTWETKYRGKLLIHASSKKPTKNFLSSKIPYEWACAITNDEYMGNFPDLNDLPLSAIIGYVDFTNIMDETESLWDGGMGINKFIFENAYLFDEPITGVNGKLNLFEYELDEDNLPHACKVKLKKPHVEGSEIVFPIANWLFDEIEESDKKIFQLYESEELDELLVREEDDYVVMKNFSTIRFERCDGKTTTFKIENSECGYLLNDKGDKIKQLNLYAEEQFVSVYQYQLGEKI